MYELPMTLNEPIERVITLQQGDSPVLQAILFDDDGTDWDDGYTATLFVGRSTTDPDEWEIEESIAITPVSNLHFFQLEAITYTRGVYSAYVYVENLSESTPVTTPDDVDYSFKPFTIEVV